MIKDSGERTVFETGAQRDLGGGKGRMDLLPMRALMRVAQHFEEGAKKYEARNWERGIPLHNFIDSGLRHTAKFMINMQDEPHLEAACWNFLCCLDTLLRIKEGTLPECLWDIPFEKEVVLTDREKESISGLAYVVAFSCRTCKNRNAQPDCVNCSLPMEKRG